MTDPFAGHRFWELDLYLLRASGRAERGGGAADYLPVLAGLHAGATAGGELYTTIEGSSDYIYTGSDLQGAEVHQRF